MPARVSQHGLLAPVIWQGQRGQPFSLWRRGQNTRRISHQVWEARNSGETATFNGEGFGFGSVQFVIFQLPSGWRQVVP